MDSHALGAMLGVEDLADRLRAVEDRMLTVMDTHDAIYGDAMRRVAGSGGKRLRPAFTIAAAALLGARGDEVVELAAAVELVQIGSLVHDDIIDSASTRRGTPTINSVEGSAAAIVAGDVLLARAGELASGVSGAAGQLVTRAIADLCLGQFLEMTDTHDTNRTVERHLQSVACKTAALFECACRLGALCAGADAATSDALGRFGNAFGMAFQLLDDILDVIGDGEALGKPVGVDVVAGVYTFPVLHALAGPEGRSLARMLPTAAVQTEDVRDVHDLVVAVGGVDAATKVMYDFGADAALALEPLAPLGSGVDQLRAFPQAYLGWALRRFVAVLD